MNTLRRWHEQSDLNTQSREILDVGCGDALFFPKLKQFGNVSGVEPDTNLIDPGNPDCPAIYTGNIDETFEPGKKFDWVILLDVLEHIEQPAEVLLHICKHLNPGARLLITVPAFNLLWTRHDEYNHHFTRYNKKTFARMANGSGLSIEKMKYFFHWMFPAKMLVRAKEAVLRGDPKPAEVPHSIINTCCFALSRIEQALITPLPIPFGSSLMISATVNHATDK